MKTALEFLSHFGICKPQPASDWQGPMPLPAALADFYQQVGPFGEEDLTTAGKPGRKPRGIWFYGGGGNEVFFPRLSDLWKAQDAFGWNFRDDVPIEGWPQNWLVFADEAGEVFVYDSDADVVRFLLPGEDFEDAKEIAGTPIEVTGAVALFSLRDEEAGDSKFTEDFDLLPSWVEKVRTEMEEKFGATGRDVMAVYTES
ncbi:hypothetical protein [Corynebacterium atrinae]|uniref:hypothetical protein n=1 Tax=Corynebacterium atrinae TaxID=1336740 RepID=UPI0025B41EC2|nr:hypothetical protein [Corynebacterium atrinae]